MPDGVGISSPMRASNAKRSSRSRSWPTVKAPLQVRGLRYLSLYDLGELPVNAGLRGPVLAR